MRWLTFRDGSGQRAGVLSGDGAAVHPLEQGVSLLELIGRGSAGLREAGEEALRSAATVRLDQVTLMAPIPRPPSIRDSLCF
ncbi:MAG: 2-hydroxyhepta-2,4-diene-1,7-dioate isomerase, partial [Mycobacterium sp.]